MEKPLVDTDYQLQKMAGKGGWTYVEIIEIPPEKRAYFGMVRVKGFIDSYKLENYNLMPMGNGHLFLPVKAEIRKKIKKEAPDLVRIVLYANDLPLITPDEMLLCLQDEPIAYKNYLNFTESNQKYYIDWIYSAKTDDTKVERMAKMIDRVAQNIKMFDKI
jgi:Bacteriocin-protection, YdeI or OmpD-Associated/Domain of unknown function (DUF1905)